MKNTIQVYETDFGTIILPNDFPMCAMRKNGLPDRRRKLAAKIREYTDDLNAGALKAFEAGRSVRGGRAMSFATWLKKAAA